ncbi:MAG: GNAT family N-acetyltransferase [Actinomycetota bacterium]|nr:GNAT family N-acetyltransferase [Actinomycetota bacterium]
MDIEIRPVLPGEYEQVGELTVRAYAVLEVDHLFGGYDTDIRDVATRVKDATVLVAVAGAEVVGAVTYVDRDGSRWLEWTEPGEAQFRLLAVSPIAQGGGVGEALARACMERAATAGRPLVIHTTRWMPAARRLYDRLGFVRRPDRDVGYDVWSADVDDYPPEWAGEGFLAYTWTP